MLEVALTGADTDADELREVARRVLETNRRGIETVDALLDLAELDARSIDPGEVDLASLTRAAVREEAASISAARLTVIDELPASVLIHGDGVLLRQAVLNLVRNAVRHNLPDGMIRLTSHSDDDAVVLTVENSGAELSDTLVATLNEPFVRGAGRITEHGPRGTGLGLAIIESIVRAHNGTLQLSRRDGGGLRAEIALPLGPRSPQST
jgi:signal transduction histidine kinase